MNEEQTTVNLETVLVAVDESIKQGLPESFQLFFIPFMTPRKFASAIGLSEGVVGGWIDQGYIPTAKVGRYRMVSMVLLVANLEKGIVL